MAKGGGFSDSSDDLLKEAAGMSDADIERLMAGLEPRGKASRVESLEPGSRVEGTVVDLRGGEVLVELDGKTLGVIDETELAGTDLPEIGERIRAQFERFDRSKDLAVLSVGGVRRDIAWEELRRGSLVEGVVTAVNKGGLTLEIKGFRAFLPASQVERGRVADLAPYVGQRLRCEVTSLDRSTRDVVVSRRLVLDREAEAERVSALARLSEGEVLTGTVARLTDHGAFVSLGGVDGLLPAAKIHAHLRARTLAEPLSEGQRVVVQVVRVDREQGRVSLDLKQLAQDVWKRAVEGYAPGEEVTGWISRRGATEAVLSIDEGVEGVIPEEHMHLLAPEARAGTITKATIVSIDAERRRIVLRPAAGPGAAGK
ncbi:MAG: 30S ribosomal protein S1 [Planctomycetes bacterium]|nr:30S ribosomal protein S1 [Planctomycetota bacterium]